MKTFENLTLDELIDYCFSIKETENISKEFPQLKNLFQSKLNLIDNIEEKDFYEIVIKDLLLEIEENYYLMTTENIKDKIVENSFDNFHDINKKIEEKIKAKESTDSQYKNNLESTRKRDLLNLYKYEQGSYRNDLLDSIKEILLERSRINNFPLDNRYFKDYLSDLSCNYNNKLTLRIIGEFKKLDVTSCKEPFYGTNMAAIIETACYAFLGDSKTCINESESFDENDMLEVSREKYKNSTCFRLADEILYNRSYRMSYFKINKRMTYSSLGLISRRNKFFNNKRLKHHLKYAKKNSIYWFKLDHDQNVCDFDYSNVYENKLMSRRDITWFKLMEVGYDDTNHDMIAYSKIGTDGSVMQDEVAYFDLRKNKIDSLENFGFRKCEDKEKVRTLHYFVADGNVNDNSGIPTVIGYSENKYCSGAIK